MCETEIKYKIKNKPKNEEKRTLREMGLYFLVLMECIILVYLINCLNF